MILHNSKFLFHGYYGFGNVGDEAVCSVLIDELQGKPGTEIIISSLDPDRSYKLHNVKSCSRKYRSFDFIKQLLTANILIFGGGGKYGWRSFRRICILSLFFKLLRKKVVFRNVGLYYYSGSAINVDPKPPKELIKRVLLLLTFNLADEITVRDEISKSFLRLCGVQKEIVIEKELALKLKPSSLERSHELLSNYVSLNRKLRIGVNLRTLESSINDKLTKIIVNILDWLIETFDAEIVFIPFGYGSVAERFFDDDRIIANEIKQKLKNKQSFKIVEKELCPKDILGIFRLFDFFIGMRYHSVVFSKVAKVPAIALVYDTKIAYFLKQDCSGISPILFNQISEKKIKKILLNRLQ